MIYWEEKDNRLLAELTFDSFLDAISFITEAAHIIEEQQHHPLWTNVYNQLTIELCTHDAGDVVTQKDRALARSLSDLFEKYTSR